MRYKFLILDVDNESNNYLKYLTVELDAEGVMDLE